MLRALALSILLALPACGGPPGGAWLARGDRGGYLRAIDARYRAGALGEKDAAELAGIAAAREVELATPEEALARVEELRACAGAIDQVLAWRMRKRDAAGAEAAWARLESGAMDAGDARSQAASALGHDGVDESAIATRAEPAPGDVRDRWRAIAAAGLVRDRDADARRRALVDPSPRVRRAALRAVREVRDPADVAAVLETARLDPEPMVRTDAVRSIPSLALSDAAAEAAALRLRDLWPTADEPLRADLANAFAGAEIYEHGGREALRLLVAQGQAGSLAAALVVHRSPRARRDPEVTDAASAVLVRAVASSARADRIAAIGAVPLEAAGALDAVRAASSDVADSDVAVAALARLAASPRAKGNPGTPADAERARGALLYSAAQEGPRGAHARSALAMLGERRVQAWIERDLVAPTPALRILSAHALASLGRSARAATLLADPEPRVRTGAACAILTARRHP